MRHLGFNDRIWSDHADILPTMLSVMDLNPGYDTQGRVLFEILGDPALPESVHNQRSLLSRLGEVYNQRPAGQLGSAASATQPRAS